MDQFDILPPEQAALLIRKKRFWKKTMWVSLALSLIVLAAGYGYYEFRTNRISSTQEGTEVNVALLVLDTVETLYICIITVPLASLAFLVFLIALIRFISLPKTPKPPNSPTQP